MHAVSRLKHQSLLHENMTTLKGPPLFLPLCITILIQYIDSFSRIFLTTRSNYHVFNYGKSSIRINGRSSALSSQNSSSILLPKLLSWFQGDFDNYHQIVQERNMWNMTPREGGGHEHIHCTLLPLQVQYLNDLFHNSASPQSCTANDTPRGAALATYYLDGNPSKIFRMRLYTLSPDSVQPDFIRMKLHSIHPQLETKLRSCLDLMEWDSIVYNYIAVEGTGLDSNSNLNSAPNSPSWLFNSFRELKDCDILWMSYPDPHRHTYLFDDEKNHRKYRRSESLDPLGGIHAFMMYDVHSQGVIVQSQTTPGLSIRIQDELSLWENSLWINDRGYHISNNSMVYGNWRGIPYQLDRVTKMITERQDGSNETKIRRQVMDPSLEWTL